MRTTFDTLLQALQKGEPVLIQTHDFPDHDAVGAAYGLAELLLRQGFECGMTYGGIIQSISLESMINRLEIPLIPFDEACQNSKWQTIIVDGSPASGTVKIVAGTLCGIIDHHPARKKIEVPFNDLRIDVGACSSIIWEYWTQSKEVPDRTTATALLAGIQLDTNFLARRVSQLDLDAHYNLFFLGDNNLSQDVVRTSLHIDQLSEIGKAFISYRNDNDLLFTEVHGDYSSELLSVVADFLLRVQEIHFVVVVEVKGSTYHLSARARDQKLDSGYIIHKALTGIGKGGGHPHMAGGVIQAEKYPGAEKFFTILKETTASYRSTHETNNQKN